MPPCNKVGLLEQPGKEIGAVAAANCGGWIVTGVADKERTWTPQSACSMHSLALPAGLSKTNPSVSSQLAAASARARCPVDGNRIGTSSHDSHCAASLVLPRVAHPDGRIDDSVVAAERRGELVESLRRVGPGAGPLPGNEHRHTDPGVPR